MSMQPSAYHGVLWERLCLNLVEQRACSCLLVTELFRSFGSSLCRKDVCSDVLFDVTMPPKSTVKLSELRAAARAAETSINQEHKTLFKNARVRAVVRYLGQVDPSNRRNHIPDPNRWVFQEGEWQSQVEIVFEVVVGERTYTASQHANNVRTRGVALTKLLKDIKRDLVDKAEEDTKVTLPALVEKARDAENALNKELKRLYGRAFVEARVRYSPLLLISSILIPAPRASKIEDQKKNVRRSPRRSTVEDQKKKHFFGLAAEF